MTIFDIFAHVPCCHPAVKPHCSCKVELCPTTSQFRLARAIGVTVSSSSLFPQALCCEADAAERWGLSYWNLLSLHHSLSLGWLHSPRVKALAAGGKVEVWLLLQEPGVDWMQHVLITNWGQLSFSLFWLQRRWRPQAELGPSFGRALPFFHMSFSQISKKNPLSGGNSLILWDCKNHWGMGSVFGNSNVFLQVGTTAQTAHRTTKGLEPTQ